MDDAHDLDADHLIAFLWREGDLSWKLDTLQAAIRNTIHEKRARNALILSSRQIGKSYLSCVMAIEWCLRQSERKIARIVAPTLKQCADIVADNIGPICADAPAYLIERVKSEYRWRIGKSELRLGALERAHVDGNRGGNASLIIYEECGFVKGDDFSYGVKSVLGPQLLRTGGIELYISSPSEDPEHPLHTVVLPRCVDLGTAFRFTVHDSPSITPDLIRQAVERCGGEDTDEWKREYLAQIIRPSTLVVIPSYDEGPGGHVSAFNEPIECMWQVTVDWGGVRDKTVALLHTHAFGDATDLVMDERVWPANTPTSDIIRGLRELAGTRTIHRWAADVPGQLQVDLQSAYGLEVTIPQKSDWQASVNAMSVRFATRKILIHPRCLFLRQSCRAGLFNKNRTDFERTIELGHMDALAALMYSVRTQDRQNPYSTRDVPRDRYFAAPRVAEDQQLAEAMAPKSFGAGSGKAFGSFRK